MAFTGFVAYRVMDIYLDESNFHTQNTYLNTWCVYCKAFQIYTNWKFSILVTERRCFTKYNEALRLCILNVRIFSMYWTYLITYFTQQQSMGQIHLYGLQAPQAKTLCDTRCYEQILKIIKLCDPSF